MNCKNLKQKLDRTLFCKRKNKIIKISECNNCRYKEYKNMTNCRTSIKSRQKSKKLAKLERNRFSILTDDLEHCVICNKPKEHLHEVFPGAFRQRSMKERMVMPLCAFHHTQIHKDTELSLYWKQSCQKLFEKSHTRDEFIKIFGRNYL